MTKYSTTNIRTKGSMLMREEPRSPPAVAAGADWAKADEMNTVILQIQATGDCMRLGFLNTEAWSLQELVIARSAATKQSSHHVLPTEVLFFGMKFKNTHKTY